MDAIFLGILAIVVLGIIVVLIYLLDKVNTLEGRNAIGVLTEAVGIAPAQVPDNGLNGLVGKALWDAVCGKGAGASLDAEGLASLRKRYSGVLHKHILSLVEDGAKDAQAGTANSPPANREISTLRAKVDSWLPPQHVKAIYTVGFEAASNPEEIPRLSQSLDETCATLYARAEIDMPAAPYSVTVFGGGADPMGDDTMDAPALGMADGTGDGTGESGADAGADAGAADADFDIKPVTRK